MGSKLSFRLSLSKVDPFVVVVGVVIFLLDQVTKRLVVAYLAPPGGPGSVQVVGDWLRLTYATNSGAAFGLFPRGTVIFAIVSIVALPVLLFSRNYVPADSRLLRLTVGLMLGGDVGNLLDRVRQGFVVDFVDAGIGNVRWAAFNVADSTFVVGIAILVLYLLLTSDQSERQPDQRQDARPGRPEEKQGEKHGETGAIGSGDVRAAKRDQGLSG